MLNNSKKYFKNPSKKLLNPIFNIPNFCGILFWGRVEYLGPPITALVGAVGGQAHPLTQNPEHLVTPRTSSSPLSLLVPVLQSA
jgi:hypothetical protein